MSKNLLYTLILLGISIFIMAISRWKQRLRIDTIKDENAVHVTITDIDCYATRSYSSLSFRHNGHKNYVNMSRDQCGRFRIGEQITVYYNAKKNLYLMKNDGTENEENIGPTAGIMIFIGSLLYVIWLVFFKKYHSK